MKTTIATLLFLLCFTCFPDKVFSQLHGEPIERELLGKHFVIEKQFHQGFLFLGKYGKVVFVDGSAYDSLKTADKISRKQFREMLKSSNEFIEPQSTRHLLRQDSLNTLFCGKEYNVVGQKLLEMRTIKIGNKKVDVIPFNEELFEVKFFTYQNQYLASRYTFVFCELIQLTEY